MESAVSLLLLLVCPLSMGLMMWLMMRSPKAGSRRAKRAASPRELSRAATPARGGDRPVERPEGDRSVEELERRMTDLEARLS